MNSNEMRKLMEAVDLNPVMEDEDGEWHEIILGREDPETDILDGIKEILAAKGIEFDWDVDDDVILVKVG